MFGARTTFPPSLAEHPDNAAPRAVAHWEALFGDGKPWPPSSCF
jgi:hypothetical protein